MHCGAGWGTSTHTPLGPGSAGSGTAGHINPHPHSVTRVRAIFLHFHLRRTLSCLPTASPGRSQPTKLPGPPWTGLSHSASSSLPRPRSFPGQARNHNRLFTVSIAEIKLTHGCHISEIPSVDQTSRLWKEDIPAASSEALAARAAPSPGPEPLLSLQC